MASFPLKDLVLSYDVEADVLYGTFGKPQKDIGFDTDEEVVVHVDPRDETRVVGFTIPNFRYRAARGAEFTIPLEPAHVRALI